MEENTNNNHEVLDQGQAIIWFALSWFLCFLTIPVGYIKMGQSTKGWVILLVNYFTGGFGGLLLVAWIADYWMCYSVQKTRPLDEWEFFPSK